MSQAGGIDTPGSLQGILIAIECVPAAILVLRAFPISPYSKEAVDSSPLDSMSGKDFKQIFGKFRIILAHFHWFFSVSVQDTVNPKDIFQDVVHNFSSRYRGYAQYHNVQVIKWFSDISILSWDLQPVDFFLKFGQAAWQARLFSAGSLTGGQADPCLAVKARQAQTCPVQKVFNLSERQVVLFLWDKITYLLHEKPNLSSVISCTEPVNDLKSMDRFSSDFKLDWFGFSKNR